LELSLHWTAPVGPAGQNSDGQQPPEVSILEADAPQEVSRRMIRLEVSSGPVPDSNGLVLHAAVVGLFELAVEGDAELTEENARWILALNGATILYGILRGEIASLSANFPSGRYLLPTVYMHEVLAAQAQRVSHDTPAGEAPPPPH
jgi:hypothetical protein